MAQTQATIEIDFEINSSAQIGDILYCSPISGSTGGFTTSGDAVKLGQITELVNDYIGFNYTAQGVGLVTVQNAFSTSAQMFISFKKDASVNESSLKGYFASVEFQNNDYNNRCELFAVGSEVSISSK